MGEAIVKHLFPSSESGRIPVVGIVGQPGDVLTAHLVSWLLQLDGRVTALACQDGLFLGQRQLSRGNALGWEGGERMLINRTVQAVVLETSARHILSEGLPYDRCEVGVVTAMPAPQGLEEFYIRDAEQMRNIVRTQIDVVLPSGAAVLNADDAEVLELADFCDGEVILYSLDEHSPAIAKHRAGKGRAVFARESTVVLATGDREVRLVNLSAPAFSRLMSAHAGDSRAPVLAAVASAWALGVSAELIRGGLQRYGEPVRAPQTPVQTHQAATQ